MAGETFFTPDSFATVASCSFAIILVTNTVRRVTRLTSPLIPFAMSLVIGFVVAGGLADKLNTPMEWLLVFLNSCLLFCTATGGQEIAVTAGQGKGPGPVNQQSSEPVDFFSSWLR
jgi:hypothetical protein